MTDKSGTRTGVLRALEWYAQHFHDSYHGTLKADSWWACERGRCLKTHELLQREADQRETEATAGQEWHAG